MPRKHNDMQNLDDARQGLLDAGLTPATRQEWIERTGQDPDDPTTWNRTIVDVIREQQRAQADG